LFDGNILKGYLAFNLRFDKQYIYLEDLIILPKYQNYGRTAARLICAFFKEIENSSLSLIRTYTNKLNKRMQGILSKAGFSIDEFTDKGIKYITTKEQLMERYSNLILYFLRKTEND
jgi:RimJ/RimL family protein N-acetyltransferase